MGFSDYILKYLKEIMYFLSFKSFVEHIEEFVY